MDEHILISGRDTLLIAFPFVILLLFSVFRLGDSIASPKGTFGRRRPPCGTDQFGEPILRDPDGRLSAEGLERGAKPRVTRVGKCTTISGN